jgi:hypothetical protein
MDEAILLNVNGNPVTNSQILIRLKAKGEYKKALSEQMLVVAMKDYAQKNSISVSDEDLQKYADTKRKELGLFSVAATEKYFANLGINIDQWSDTIEEELLKEKIKKAVVTDEKIKDYFEANRLRFICIPLHRIVVKEKSMAEEKLKQVAALEGAAGGVTPVAPAPGIVKAAGDWLLFAGLMSAIFAFDIVCLLGSIALTLHILGVRVI